MNILCLHRMGDPNNRLEAVRALEYMIAEVRHDLNVVVHDCDVPFPSYMKDIDYDLIVLGPTFLCYRHSPKDLKVVLSTYDFIKYSNACKVALPQDDYDCPEILEDWLLKWNVSCVYAVCPEDWSALYPKLNRKGLIRLGYTGYISEDWINSWRSPKPIELRAIDVSYRAKKTNAYHGRLGQLKWEIADRFLQAVNGMSEMKMDVSVNPKDIIPGIRWHDFLENSKFCLATPSGSSLLDPRGAIRACVNQYLALRHKANFCKIESNCFAGKDGQYIFTALSPRNLEAALAETVQIATPGSYSGLMQPYEHFILLEEDCSNIDEVFEQMSDTLHVGNIRKKCKEAVLSESRLRRLNIVNEIINFAQDHLSSHQRGVVADSGHAKSYIDRYNSEIKNIEHLHWRRSRLVIRARSIAVKLGARRIRDLIAPNRH